MARKNAARAGIHDNDLGVRAAQGFLFARPGAPGDIGDLLGRALSPIGSTTR